MLTVLNSLSGFQICALLSAVNLILNLVIIHTGDVRPASTVDIATAYTKRQLSKFSTRDKSSMWGETATYDSLQFLKNLMVFLESKA